MKSISFNYLSSFIGVVVLTTLFHMSCKTQSESVQNNAEQLAATQASVKDFGDKSQEYRSFPVEVAFFDPATEGANPGLAIQKRKEFITQSGLPNEANISEYKKQHPTVVAFDTYNNYIQKNTNSPYLKTFEQYGAWLLLTRLDILSQTHTNDLQIIYSLLEKLVKTKYEGYQLLSYGIAHLYQNKFNNENLKNLGTTILDYSDDKSIDNSKFRATNSPDISATNLPPEIKQSIGNYSKTKESNKTAALDQIRQIVSKL